MFNALVWHHFVFEIDLVIFFNGHSRPSSDSGKAHCVLVNCSVGLILLKKRVIGLTGSLAMNKTVDRGR